MLYIPHFRLEMHDPVKRARLKAWIRRMDMCVGAMELC